MRTTKVLLLIGIMAIATFGYSRDVYVRYDNTCMDRLEYARNDNSRYVTYQLKKNDQERIILEVGNETANFNNNLPGSTINCQGLQINESLAREINNGDIRLFVVRPYSTGYLVSPVKTANFFYSTDAEVGYSSSEDYVFVYNLSVKTKGINLATKDSQAKVYFRGTEANSCPTKYYFRKISNENYQPYTDMIIVPKVGIVETKTGRDAVDANRNRMTLVSFNNIPVDKYMDAVCNGYEKFLKNELPATTTTDPTVTATPPGNKMEDLERPGSNTPTYTGPTTGPAFPTPQCTIYKDVDRNLYIDRATGLPANGSCGGNDYRNGYMLNKTADIQPNPAVPPGQPAPSGTTTYTPPPGSAPGTGSSPSASRRGSDCNEVSTADTHVVQRDETLYAIARRYNVSIKDLREWNNIKNINVIQPCSRLNIRPQALVSRTGDTQVGSTGTSNTHVVQKDETLYSIAREYGYTASKLAQMNGILTTDRIYPGQRLKVSDCNCPAVNNVNTASVPREYDNVNTRTVSETLTDRGAGDRVELFGPGNRRVYVVQENDTIYSIAKKYGTSVEELRRLNNLEKTEIIIPFQRIYLD